MYEFTTGLIRVLEKRLLDKTDIERMVLAKNPQAAFDVLNDTDLADNLHDHGPEDYNEIVAEDFEQLKKLFRQNIDKTPLFSFMFAEFDFINIKIILKKKLLDKKINQPLNSLGLINPVLLKNYFNLQYKFIKLTKGKKHLTELSVIARELQAKSEHKYQTKIDALLRDSINHIILKIIKAKKKSINPRSIDIIVDKYFWKYKKSLAKKINSRFVNDLVKLQIDFLNTKILLRSITEKKDNQFRFDKELSLTGGRFTSEDLRHLFKQDKPVMFKNLKEIMEWYRIDGILDEFKEQEDLWRLEWELDKSILEFSKIRAQSSSYGPSVLVAYFLAKMNAMQNVKIIMSGKLNSIKTQEIQNRIII